MANPRFDAKLNRSKGFAAGGAAAIVSAVTSVFYVIAKNMLPTWPDSDIMTGSASLSLIICTLVMAWWAMHQNRIKHG